MIYTPHDYQSAFLVDYLKWVDGDYGDSSQYRLYTAPTGTGKSVMELMALEADPYSLLVTPRLEIVAGMLAKMGCEGVDKWGEYRLAQEALARRITTPIRLRNLLAKGSFMNDYLEAYGTYITGFKGSVGDWYAGSMPSIRRILFDEGHHLLADSYKDIKAYLPHVQVACLTATGFRGTPKETEQFLELFGGVINQVLSLPQAAERGLFTTPSPSIWSLVDDDTLQVANGEIQVQSATAATANILTDVVERCRNYMTANYRWDRPTMFAVPSTDAARMLRDELCNYNLPAELVVQDTPRSERNTIFRQTVAREIALVQIDVVSEGVDLPIRRLIDLRPTLSPVRWMQQLGRITRPFPCDWCRIIDGVCSVCHGTGYGKSEYICTNRNLERHGYLLEGLLPPSAMKLAQEAFGKISQRSGARVVGLEGIGKFKATHLPLQGGLTGLMYNVTTMDGYRRKDYVILCHPCSSTPIIAARESLDDGTEMKWGRFTRVDKLPDLSGYGSAPAKTLTPKQEAWWKREAARFGLDAGVKVNKRTFAALPVLRDLRIELRGGDR